MYTVGNRCSKTKGQVKEPKKRGRLDRGTKELSWYMNEWLMRVTKCRCVDGRGSSSEGNEVTADGSARIRNGNRKVWGHLVDMSRIMLSGPGKVELC